MCLPLDFAALTSFLCSHGFMSGVLHSGLGCHGGSRRLLFKPTALRSVLSWFAFCRAPDLPAAPNQYTFHAKDNEAQCCNRCMLHLEPKNINQTKALEASTSLRRSWATCTGHSQPTSCLPSQLWSINKPTFYRWRVCALAPEQARVSSEIANEACPFFEANGC